MARETIQVTVAGIKLTLSTTDKDTVTRMANTLDASVQRKLTAAKNRPDVALLMLAMEQADNLKRNAALIHRQQEQIFALTTRNAALLGEAAESAPIEETESIIYAENMRLIKKNEELADEIERLKALLEEK